MDSSDSLKAAVRPEETGDGCNESPSHRSRHCSIGGRRWRRVGLSSELSSPCRLRFSSGEVNRRLFPVHREGQEEAELASAALQKAVEFKCQCDDEVDVGPLLASQPEGPVVKRCWWEDFVHHCDEEMQEWMECRSPGGRCGRISPGSGEGFSTHHHCCSVRSGRS